MKTSRCITVLSLVVIFAFAASILGCSGSGGTQNGGGTSNGSGKPALLFFHSPG